MSDKNDGDYEVGYGRPPAKTRYQAGQSGNPKGRPKGAKNLVALILQELDQQLVVNEGGKRHRITKREAIVKQLVNSSAKGDSRSLQLLMKLSAGHEEPTADHGPMLSEDDRKTLETTLARLKQKKGGGEDGND